MVGRGKRAKPIKAAGRRKKPKSEDSSSAPPPPPPPWTELPQEITANILQRLDVVEILERAQKVCMTWRSVCKDPSMWRKIHMSNNSFGRRNHEIMCRHAVDRSQGQLLDFAIHNIGDALLLEYVAQRSPQLRCLSLTVGWRYRGIQDDVVKTVKCFPLLEELHLFFFRKSGELIEQVGHCCPLLKSFTLKKQGWKSRNKKAQDSEALAIANTMPGLRHLCLFGNRMSNEGLVAILDGCAHLESLDLRLCSNIDLSGDLGERCCRQIKSVKKSSDFTASLSDFPQSDSSDSYNGEEYYDNGGPYWCLDTSSESDPDDHLTYDWLKTRGSLSDEDW